MRISDWSSDVCSSDLQSRCLAATGFRVHVAQVVRGHGVAEQQVHRTADQEDDDPYPVHRIPYSAGDVPGWDLLRPVPYRRSAPARSEEHTSELQSLMRISYAVFCLKKKKKKYPNTSALPADTQACTHETQI